MCTLEEAGVGEIAFGLKENENITMLVIRSSKEKGSDYKVVR